jgi:hypothetical protein
MADGVESFSMARKALTRWIPAIFLLLVFALALWWAQSGRRPAEYAVAYVADPSAILWNANAQVRQPVTTLHYGDRLAILQRSGERVEVRSDAGARGWIDAPTLMDAELWQQSAELLSRARTMPVQARGHTRTISNVRLTSGRDGPRIYQFGRNEPVVVLERSTSPAPPEGGGERVASPAENLPKLEDWLLVMRTMTGPTSESAGIAGERRGSPGLGTPIAGWVLARFIELDPPPPIPDYFSAAGLHVAAWVVLNTAPDAGGPRPQYLVAGARGGEGQPCDFTLLRVYTWSANQQRYETAYVENDICGRMPIRVTSTPAGVEFRFANPAQRGTERVYRMRQTSVRRVADAALTPPRPQR